jgi:hypothetical protein
MRLSSSLDPKAGSNWRGDPRADCVMVNDVEVEASSS